MPKTLAFDVGPSEDDSLEITGHGYLASPLTDNIRQMDDGSLVIENCPIARTGWQQYAVRDLPQEAARRLGVDLSNPSANIDLYRPEEEVFAPEFIASLEGRPICDNHPPSWITPGTFNQYAKGHIQNVHRGDEPLPSGDWPLLADLVISGEPLVAKVRDKLARENSLGYDYSIAKDGDKILQVGMVGNHLAVVPKGRAGDDVRIMDAAASPATESPPPDQPVVDAGTASLSVSTAPLTTALKKEKQPVSNILKHLLGLGLKQYATDAEPEKLAEAAEAVNQVPPAESDDRHTRDRVRDTSPDLFETTTSRDRHRGKDAPEMDPVDQDQGPSDDRRTDDKRKAAHDALDTLLDAMGGRRGRDTDIPALRGLLDQLLTEEQGEPEHQEEDADPAELEELLGAGEEPDAEDRGHDTEAQPGEKVLESGEATLEDASEGGMECAHCGTAHDEEACPACGCTDRKPRARADDRARAADGIAATLKMLRPFVARSNDQAVRRAFNTALGTLRRRSRATTGSYGAFADGARARDRSVGTDPNLNRRRAADARSGQSTRDEKVQAYYDERAKGGK